MDRPIKRVSKLISTLKYVIYNTYRTFKNCKYNSQVKKTLCQIHCKTVYLNNKSMRKNKHNKCGHSNYVVLF